ncbi:MAG: amidohydrolase [Pseudomonadota bacterium]|nr:amidohydrolase [Pseudomonadota bacterium]
MPLTAVRIRALVALLVAVVTLSGCAGAAGAVRATEDPAIRVDHHVHLNSPDLQAAIPAFCENIKRYGGCDPALTTVRTPADLLSAMDAAGVGRALVVSTGYLAESPLMPGPMAERASLMRSANDWTVDVARRHPDRLRAFVAVEPLQPTALPEIARWRGAPSVAGVKLHLTSSGVDLRNEAHLDALAGVFAAASESQLAVLVHLRTQRSDYGAPDVERFIEHVLPALHDGHVQIAHAAGWGGIDPATLSALGAFAAAMEADPARFEHVWFDLSGVWTDTTPEADRQALVALIRRIGIHHFLPGSDWPYAGADLADYYSRVYPLLPLQPAEWATLRGNVAPFAAASADNGP